MSKLQCSRIIITLVVLLCAPGLVSAKQTVIWYLPHPDDETIGMADNIYQSVEAGNTNYFIYFSKGSSSLARHNLRGPDGSTHRLSVDEFGKARVRETLAALEVLGVDSCQVLFFDFPDGSIPQEPVEETMRFFAQLYPGSIHRTVSFSDPHEDHQTLARSLAKVTSETEGEMFSEYFHVYIYRSVTEPHGIEKRPVKDREVKEKALAELTFWDPDSGRYAIANQSTPDLVEAAGASAYEYVDIPGMQGLRGTGPRLVPGVTLSSRDLGVFFLVNERLSLDALFDYKTGGIATEVNYRLRDDIPLVQLTVGGGYHLWHGRPYVTTRAELARSYFLRVRHVFQTDTSIAIGLTTRLGSY